MSDKSKSLRPAERSAGDIARDLREEFARALYATTGAQAQPDPVLAALFHSLAVQIDRVYEEADRVFFEAALDDLIRGLGMPARLARPAQAVVQFAQIADRELITPETELIGYRQSGEQLTFTPDVPFEISSTELVFAGAFEGGKLVTLAGARLPWANVPLLAGASAPLKLAQAAPSLFLAFQADARHLSNLGVFIDFEAPGSSTDRGLSRSPWQLLNEQGIVTEGCILRATAARGGIRQLRFVQAAAPTAEFDSAPARALVLPSGPFGPHVWLLPEIPVDRRFACSIPPALRDAIPRLLPAGLETALDRPLAWLQIPLPIDTRGVASSIRRIAIHCITASNVEIWNESIEFGRMGRVVGHRPMGSDARHVMGILSVTGEGGSTYVDSADLDAPPRTGRYRVRTGDRLDFAPALHASGRADRYAMLRLLYCDAEEANGIEAGGIKQIRTDLPRNPTARVSNLTPTKGGASPPAYDLARERFAELLRTRERVVTAADIDIAARAYEPLLRHIDVVPASEITDHGLQLVTQVTAYALPGDFADPEADFEQLRGELQCYLDARSMIGNRIAVTVRPVRAE